MRPCCEHHGRLNSMRRLPVLPMLVFLTLVLTALPCLAKIDIAALSDRDEVQTTIYKSRDLTLVRDSRTLQLAKGDNQLQFSWANTRIDPTSLTLDIKTAKDLVQITEMRYPPNAKDLAIWQIRAREACQARVDILYFTSGLSWESYYTALLSLEGNTMSLKGYVRVSNHSGEDYAHARTRLVVGKINLLEEIADLAGQRYPYGRPDLMEEQETETRAVYAKGLKMLEAAAPIADQITAQPKQIAKQGMSEYFLYTIEGKETIEDGWSRRLVSFEADNIPVANTYTYEKERHGDQPIRRLVFSNGKKEGLGTFPLPGGKIKVFQALDTQGALAFKGSDDADYMPVNKTVELNLGPVRDVVVDPRVMTVIRTNLRFDDDGNLTGFDEVRETEIHLANYSGAKADLEVIQNLDTAWFTLDKVETQGKYERTDQDTLTFFNTLAPGAKTVIRFQVTIHRGDAQ